MRLDDVLTALGNNRDYLILGLALLVLVEGAIIVLWARRVFRLRRELASAVSAAQAARVAAVEEVSRPREVYSVAARAAVSPAVPAASQWTPPAADDVRGEDLETPPAADDVRTEDLGTPAESPQAAPVDSPRVTPEVESAPVPEPPAEFVSPAAARAAAWVLPEVAAAPTNGNGHHPAPAPTTLGWSGTPVPVEPAADFAVVSDPAAQQAAASTPNLTVLDGARTWSIPAAPPPSAPTHFDPAMFDSNDDTIDDGPITGDVLLVEDDPTIAKLYRVLLESRGYTVRHAGDGIEGLDRANEKRPDLILLDIMMPRMNGIAFLQALRSGEMREVPVVVLSNFMEKQLVDDAMSLGALEYMVKAQTRPEALVGALPHWLRGERAFSY